MYIFIHEEKLQKYRMDYKYLWYINSAGCAWRSPIIRSLGDFLLQPFQESPLVEPRPVDSLFRSFPSSALWSGYYYLGS